MSKNDHDTARWYGVSLSGKHADFMDNFIHGDWYSLVVAITVEGYIAARVIAGSYDAIEFHDCIAEQVVCWPLFCQSFCSHIFHILEMNPYPAHQSILVLDNCQIHHNVDLVDLVNAASSFNWMLIATFKGCLLLYLPAYSLDLNPIEEYFSACKSKSAHHLTADVVTPTSPIQ